MIAEMGKKVAVSFLKNNVITKEEVDVYQYGAELVISQTFATVAILGMGIALGKFQETVIYCKRKIASTCSKSSDVR